MTKSWPDSCVGSFQNCLVTCELVCPFGFPTLYSESIVSSLRFRRVGKLDMAFFGLVATFFRGCRTYTRRKVLHVPDQESLPEQKHELRNQLPINSTEEQTAFTSVLREWRLSQRHKTSPSSGTLWMSKNLSEHLNLAVNTPRPASITHQAFFMEAGLPAFLITVFNPDLGNTDKEKVHRYAVEILQHHSRTMKDFCPHPFIVLPLTMKAEDLTAEKIESRIKDEADRASYYTGPGDLSEAAYTSLNDGMEAASAGTMMPHFLQDNESEPEWIIQLPSEWRNLLYTFIEFMKEGTGHVQHACFHGSFQAVKFAFLEALRRVSFTTCFEVKTTDDSIKASIRKSVQHTMTNQCSKEQWGFSEVRMSGGIKVFVSHDVITFERPSQSSKEADPDSSEEKLRLACPRITCNKHPSSLTPERDSDFDVVAFKRDLQKITQQMNSTLPSNSTSCAAEIKERLCVTGGDEETKFPSQMRQNSTWPLAHDKQTERHSGKVLTTANLKGLQSVEDKMQELNKEVERLLTSQNDDVLRSVFEGEQVRSTAQPALRMRLSNDCDIGQLAVSLSMSTNEAQRPSSVSLHDDRFGSARSLRSWTGQDLRYIKNPLSYERILQLLKLEEKVLIARLQTEQIQSSVTANTSGVRPHRALNRTSQNFTGRRPCRRTEMVLRKNTLTIPAEMACAM